MPTFHQAPSPTVGRLAILAAAILWSTSGLFVKTLLLPPVTVSIYRTVMAGLVLLAIFLARRGRFAFELPMLAMITSFAIMNYLFISATTYTTSANAIFLQYTAPLWMTLGSVVFLKESTDRRQLWVVAGSLVGVAVILMGNRTLDATHRLGMVLGVASGLFFAGVVVAMRFLRHHEPLWLTIVNLLGGALILAGAQIALTIAGVDDGAGLVFPWDLKKGVLLALFGTFQMGLPYVLFGWGLRSVSPQEAGILALSEPILNPVWTYLGSGEVPSLPTMAGGGILLAMLAARYIPQRGSNG